MSRIDQEGWVEIGKRCSANRRSLWVRVNQTPESLKVSKKNKMGVFYVSIETVESIEFCAGREGDDSYVKIEHNNPQFDALLDLACTAMFAAET